MLSCCLIAGHQPPLAMRTGWLMTMCVNCSPYSFPELPGSGVMKFSSGLTNKAFGVHPLSLPKASPFSPM